MIIRRVTVLTAVVVCAAGLGPNVYGTTTTITTIKNMPSVTVNAGDTTILKGGGQLRNTTSATINGTLAIQAQGLLWMENPGSILGTGSISIDGAGNGANAELLFSGSAVTTDVTAIGAGILIHGSGIVTGVSFAELPLTLINQGTIDADKAGHEIFMNLGQPATFTNQGTVKASAGTLEVSVGTFANEGSLVVGSGGTMILSSAKWSNTGTMTVSGTGTLTLAGTVSSVGQLVRQGPNTVINFQSTYDAGGQDFEMNATTGSWNFLGSIKNAVLQFSDGQQLNPVGGQLEGCTVATNWDMAPGSVLGFVGDLTLKNDARISLAAGSFFGFSNDLTTPVAAQLLGSGGEILLPVTGTATISSGQRVGIPASVVGPGVHIHGGNGFITYGSFTNKGIIDSDVRGDRITLSGGTFENDGVLRASDGTISPDISSGNLIENAGVLEVSGSGQFTGMYIYGMSASSAVAIDLSDFNLTHGAFSAVTFAGDIPVLRISGGTAGQTYLLFQGLVSDPFTADIPGYVLSYDAVQHTLSATVAPEPATLGVLSAGGMLLLRARRGHRRSSGKGSRRS